MLFREAFELMKQGKKLKLPSWAGYWYWSKDKQTIIMHTKDGVDMDIRETQIPDYTFSNIASDEWVLADDQNCPELGGEATFGFGDAYKFLTMQRPDEHSKMTAPYVYITIDGDYRVPWHPSQADMSEKDWVLYEEE